MIISAANSWVIALKLFMNLRSPLWLEVQNDICRAMPDLPAEFPRPDSLISPTSETELEEWKKLELSRREKVENAIREWLRNRKWPSGLDLDGIDGWFLHLRMQAAMDWLALGRVGVIFGDHPTILLSRLLLDGWPESFLDEHLRDLEYRIAAYRNGFRDSGGFCE